MAATDQNYRSPKTLDIVFAVSCILMLLSTFWMFWQDYNREFKAVQREFRDVEEAMNEHSMIDQLPTISEVDAKRQVVTEAKKKLDAKRAEVRTVERDLMAKHDLQDNTYRSIKADFDAKTSYLNIAVEHLNKSEPNRKSIVQKEVDDLRAEVTDLQDRLAKAQDKLDEIDLDIKKNVTQPLDGPQQELAQAEDNLKQVTAVFDRYAKVTAQKSWKFGDWFRTLPIIDGFESPTKIKQIWLPDLTIDYGGFKDVPRYDRCISCHLGIDRGSFDRASVTRLTRSPEVIQKDIDKAAARKGDLESKGASEEDVKRADAQITKLKAELERANGMEDKLAQAREMLIARAKNEKLGFDPTDLPKKVRWLNLNKGQITEYAAHPRLDLFVDANSAHPMEKFGCTGCHQGQGSATDFVLAVHTPPNAEVEEEWRKQYGWDHSEFWDYPMLSNRFTESSCIKCHHEVTDLVRHGSKEEAPKLLRGYRLVQENGCFGCHEISSIKAGREVGPDLRLEPQPALAYQTSAEQDKAKSDPLNMPGAYRKVGPSLRRIAEKSNEDWMRKWIQAPRDFRPDTKMPHFFGLSTNAKDVLPDEQKKFPDTEIYGLAHYLMAESKANLEGKDNARDVLKSIVAERQTELKKGFLAEREWKQLLEASRRLGDLGLIAVPTKANEINRLLNQQKQMQEILQELRRKEIRLQAEKPDPKKLSEDEIAELEQKGKELDEATKDLIAAIAIVPLAKEITDEAGKAVDLPKAGDAAKGRTLFTEKGCLACHSHDGTTKGVGIAKGEAHFAPNLSRVAAKISPEVGGPDAKRRWVIQWVMNPTVYHPRTRMPITHLSAQEASDIAEWLLGQKVTDWEEKGPEAPKTEDLVALARVYLGKAPGFTRLDVDNMLPTSKGELPGILGERLKNLPPDSDERKLEGPVTDDKLKWYIGRKAVNRLGCFGCHDVPGFETAKPIGTALNDWGKKDGARLAFEDSDLWVRDHLNVVKLRDNPEDPSKAAADWHSKDGKPPYEELFAQELDHHKREGFLSLKLMEPRSFDYHRIRTWDDRLRMPQFRFSRTKRHDGESDDDFHKRQEFEEARAREDVMTFILGLVADPMPAKYLNKPGPDRLAEVKGHQVLEKFNCIGCHQVRAGVYEFKTSTDGLKRLEDSYDSFKKSQFQSDHSFLGNNAWNGAPQTTPDRLTVFGTDPKIDETSFDDKRMLVVRLSDALRFSGNDKIVRNLPAATVVPINPEELVSRSDPWGGTFTDLMVKYMKPRESDADKVRSKLPPPLIREGERVQPDWVYGFLLNPPPVRPTSYMMLRMPKFNMSNEDARSLANYFSGVSRLSNPGAGVTAEYVDVPQRDEQCSRARTTAYVKRLKADKQFDARVEEMKPVWQDTLKRRIAEAEAGLEAANQTVKDAKETEEKGTKEERAKKVEDRKQKEADVVNRKAAIAQWKKELDDKDSKNSPLRKQWEEEGAYASDAYRLLTDRNLCLQCHDVGSVKASVPQGPNLDLTGRRLRPDWVKEWLANPDRLFGYKPAMPQNFPRDSLNYQKVFDGRSIEQITAVRDVLMDLSRVADMPGNRSRAPVAPGGGK